MFGGWIGAQPEDQPDQPEQPEQPAQPEEPAPQPAWAGLTRSGKWNTQTREEGLAALETEKAANRYKRQQEA